MILFFLKELIKPAFFAFRLAKSRRQLIKEYPTIKLLGKFNVINSNFGKYNRLCSCSINNSSLGDYSYVSSGTNIKNCEIGNFTCIGPDVSIGLGSHPSRDFISIHPVFYSKEKQVSITFSDKNYFEEYENTIIGNDVWIGANVIINGGVVIEDGSIIAAGSVVTKNVESYSIVGGVPARLIRKRFVNEDVKKIIDSKWWLKDQNWLKKNFKKLHNITEFKKIND